VSLILSSSFQSLGYSRYTLVVNLCRQLLFIVPIAWLMSLSGNLSLVWTATVLAEALSMLLATLLNRKVHA
jgi:Na+-driven multidrug efflux pump